MKGVTQWLAKFPQLVSGTAGVWTKTVVVTFLSQRVQRKLQGTLTNSFNWPLLQVQTWSTVLTPHLSLKWLWFLWNVCHWWLIILRRASLADVLWCETLLLTWVSQAHTCLAMSPEHASPWLPFTWAISQGFVCTESNLEGADTISSWKRSRLTSTNYDSSDPPPTLRVSHLQCNPG